MGRRNWRCVITCALAYFLPGMVFMFFEQKRKLVLTGAPVYLSLTWLLYGSLILLYIL